jgi:hypothetical protein
VKSFWPLGTDASHVFAEWFEILGKSDVDGPGTRSPFDAGKAGNFLPFGWLQIGGKAEYQTADRLVLEGVVGGFWTVDKTACTANFRDESLTGPCFSPIVIFTGYSRYAGTEIDAGLRETILPGLTWTPRFSWAFVRNAFATNNRQDQDAWIFVTRVIYMF